MDYVNVVGLACDVVGAVWLAWGLFLWRVAIHAMQRKLVN